MIKKQKPTKNNKKSKTNSKKQKVTIIGFGRFGKVLYELLKDNCEITAYNRSSEKFKDYEDKITIATTLEQAYKNKVIFYCVPIENFEQVISDHSEYFKDHLLIDTLSVKKFPEKILKQKIKGTNCTAILTHPLFGPDSSKKGFKNLPFVISNINASQKNYKKWKEIFSKKELNIIEISADEHDKLAANSQGLAHFIGRLLNEFGLKQTPIDTLGAQRLLQVMEQTCNDTWQLFENLQTYNPYTKNMRLKLGESYEKIFAKLVPNKIDNRHTTFGIQGGAGSFNEEAINNYLDRHNVSKSQIVYLYTSHKVLQALYACEIDYGLFAIENSVGGLVHESIHAMAEYKFKIVEEFEIRVRHYLMKKANVDLEDVNQIMAHPQVFKQCQSTLAKKFKKYELVSGEGDYLDTAKAAEALAEGDIEENTAILGPKALATMYNLEIIAEDLQDDKTNNTKFLLVSR